MPSPVDQFFFEYIIKFKRFFDAFVFFLVQILPPHTIFTFFILFLFTVVVIAQPASRKVVDRCFYLVIMWIALSVFQLFISGGAVIQPVPPEYLGWGFTRFLLMEGVLVFCIIGRQYIARKIVDARENARDPYNLFPEDKKEVQSGNEASDSRTGTEF